MVFDILGRELKIDDCVVHDRSIYRITRFTTKMVGCAPIRSSYRKKDSLKYASELTLVPAEDVSWWLLKNPK